MKIDSGKMHKSSEHSLPGLPGGHFRYHLGKIPNQNISDIQKLPEDQKNICHCSARCFPARLSSEKNLRALKIKPGDQPGFI